MRLLGADSCVHLEHFRLPSAEARVSAEAARRRAQRRIEQGARARVAWSLHTMFVSSILWERHLLTEAQKSVRSNSTEWPKATGETTKERRHRLQSKQSDALHADFAYHP